MLEVIIQTIPHHAQRYNTIGDWIISPDKNKITIYVSDLKNKYYEYLVADHELREAMLCLKRNISEESVSNFDIIYEAGRRPNDTTSEPGDSVAAPYYKEHQFATMIEHITCAELDLDWKDYENSIYNIDEPSCNI